jgi:hypothetical protein
MDIGRDEARELAREELRDPAYDRDPSVSDRVVEWLSDRFNDLFGGTGTPVSSSPVFAVIIAILLIVVIVIIVRYGPVALRNTRSRRRDVFEAERLTADTYRQRAESAAAARDLTRAIIERFRAIVATAEERGIIDERAGRTADEAARDIGHEVPALTTRLSEAAAIFDAIRYGTKSGDQPGYRWMCELDADVQQANLDSADTPATSANTLAVPQ